MDTKTASLIASELAFAKAAPQAAHKLAAEAESLKLAAGLEGMIGRLGVSERNVTRIAKHSEADESRRA